MPKKMIDGFIHDEYIQQPATKAGDVVLFSEGTVHGALPWTVKDRQRRSCLYVSVDGDCISLALHDFV